MTQQQTTRICVVTGGSEGIGQALVHSLSDRCKVWTCSRTKPYDVKNWVCCDVSVQSQIQRFVQHVIETDGHIDYLINNAGLYSNEEILDIKTEKWTEIIDTNLNGPLRFTKAILPGMMQKNFGRIVNISSGVVHREDLKGRSAYAASKAGLNMFTRALAQECEEYNIKVNAVCPGRVNTKMDVNNAAKRDPEDVTKHIIHLLDESPDFPTGKFWRYRRQIDW